ncbi:hypothetical protein N7452_010388 [Penicillium brevicompactum]|uniref:AB hydrolase-1 domain-containing protein n=1 Tax=Penicillium brevicompactum TaxID=5074 RepID=A0A9W9QCS6_PENBR|nr:hypothetical protein N7452_010388 [Penicillium brevicompactum]
MSRFRVTCSEFKQYVPIDNPSPQEGDITLVGAHANGFPKKLYEPLWDNVYDCMRSQNQRIRSIWIADVAQQGQSGVLNESILGNDPSWYDHERDLLYLLNHFNIPQPIVGVGHSMGGMQLAHLSLMHPSLFVGLILIDPVIQRENPSRKYALHSTYRRDIWPSRKDAMKKFQSKLFTFLRPSYIDKRSGLRIGNPSDEMHPDDIDEFPFYRPEPSHIFRRLPELKPSVLYLFGESSDLSSQDARRAKMETTGTGVGGSGGAVRGCVHENVLPCGHLVPMELPKDSAKSCSNFIDTALASWNFENSQYQKAWGNVPRDERNKIDKQWERHIGPLPKGTKL